MRYLICEVAEKCVVDSSTEKWVLMHSMMKVQQHSGKKIYSFMNLYNSPRLLIAAKMLSNFSLQAIRNETKTLH